MEIMAFYPGLDRGFNVAAWLGWVQGREEGGKWLGS